jgi:hypothetical protein
MVAKAIHYTDHAVKRLSRGFTREDVRWLIAQGVRAVWPSKGPTTYWASAGHIRGREARVLFIEDAHRYLIISIEWVGEGKED